MQTESPENGPAEQKRMRPCCLAISADVPLGPGVLADTAVRRWRALSLDTNAELLAGDLVTNADDPLVVVREKAATAVRERGFEAQRFVLED